MTRFWKTVLLVILIVPIMLLVVAAGWYARAQAPQGQRDLLVNPPGVAKLQDSDLRPDAPSGERQVRDDIGESRLKELREKAALAEKRSIERASVIRERLKQSERVGDAEVKKALRSTKSRMHGSIRSWDRLSWCKLISNPRSLPMQVVRSSTATARI